jgi:peptide/nickel transport system substrate-binding protein
MEERRGQSAVGAGASLRISRRAALTHGLAVWPLSLLVVCNGPRREGSAPTPPAATQPIAASQRTSVPLRTAAGTRPGPTPTVVAPFMPAPPAPTAARPTATAPVAARAAPSGRLVYGWHTAIFPSWLDPQENLPLITPYNFQYCLHDALVKHQRGRQFAPSLAESYEISRDNRAATFRLRAGITFHDGQPITPEDVAFTFNAYRGANAGVLKAKTAAVETVDARTVRFRFHEPFLDFLTLYGSPASGAGWIVPKAYYERVGPDGFKERPIGAGPFRLVRQQAGTELEFEAFEGYWARPPRVKTIIMRAVPQGAERVAGLQQGDLDVTNLIPGDLVQAVRRDPKLRLVPVLSGPGWIETGAVDRPDSPLNDVRVRQALSLAIGRRVINDAEMAGLGALEGSWIPADWPGSLTRPIPEHNLARARHLLAEAGVARGFEISALTAQPPYGSWGERIVGQLRALGIHTRVNTMERATFYDRLAAGPDRLTGLLLVLSGAPGDAASRIRDRAVCGGAFSGLCLPDIDQRMQRYEASADPRERQRLLNEVQAYLLDQYLMIPVLRQAMLNGLGPRIANRAEDIMGAIPQYVYLGPYEEIALDG